ncbi:MAG: hypothetical protein CM1200mP14_07770 [Gammaproteobacteria bacterium]|nr:MAG: hypothetical protein CM1200mP14_07770 [Gammaproteobacteria bacterium]
MRQWAKLEAEPGAPNVIPGRVTMTLEIRDLSMAGIERVFNEISGNSVRITEEIGTRFSFQRFYTSRAAPTALWIREIIEISLLKASAFRPTACPQEPVTTLRASRFLHRLE